jgi:ABC-type glutathione transport system ATPase component
VPGSARHPASRDGFQPDRCSSDRQPPPLLEVQDLVVEIGSGRKILDAVSFSMGRGEGVALVGTSGSGKTALALAILRLLPEPLRIAGGRVLLEGEDLLGLGPEPMRLVRGRRIGLLPQEPGSALNPVLRVGEQVTEILRMHGATRAEARERTLDLLGRTGIPSPRESSRAYPHELSGGQRQRLLLAIALAAAPELLVADEPTASLDASMQAQVAELLLGVRREGTALLLITHDLTLAKGLCDRVVVLHGGRVVETGETPALFDAPSHPVTRTLLEAARAATLVGLGRGAPGTTVAGGEGER